LKETKKKMYTKGTLKAATNSLRRILFAINESPTPLNYKGIRNLTGINSMYVILDGLLFLENFGFLTKFKVNETKYYKLRRYARKQLERFK